MTTMEYWEEVVECPACPEGHQRFLFHSLGMVCGRCGEHTGNNHQGHYWKFCKVLKDMAEDFHFCCPGNCELHQGIGNDELVQGIG